MSEQNPRQLIENFEIQIQNISVKDFGDFKRKANAYLARLEESLGRRDLSPLMTEMKTFLTYNPNFKMEPTRKKLIEFTQRIKERVQ